MKRGGCESQAGTTRSDVGSNEFTRQTRNAAKGQKGHVRATGRVLLEDLVFKITSPVASVEP